MRAAIVRIQSGRATSSISTTMAAGYLDIATFRKRRVCLMLPADGLK
jgi:hypothetical protein